MNVKKLPFRCEHCRLFFPKDNECLIYNIHPVKEPYRFRGVGGENFICKNFDLDFSRIFPAIENPFTAAFFHWCDSGLMSPGRNDLIKLIENDPMREKVFESHEWKKVKMLWLDWIFEKVFEYALQLMRVKEKTNKDLKNHWKWKKEYGEDEKKMTNKIITNTRWEQYVDKIYHGRGLITDGLIPMIITAVFKVLKEDNRLKGGDNSGKNESGND